MKLYTGRTVLEEARIRVARVFNEFPNVMVAMSGGKDSTAVFHLAIDEATRRGRLPLKVVFVDQEAEWQATIDYVSGIMSRPDVEPLWIQAPFNLDSAHSKTARQLSCWDPAEEKNWIHPKQPGAITDVMGCRRFYGFFPAIMQWLFPASPCAIIGGVRCAESPARALALTSRLTYKEIPWGKTYDAKAGHYTFYPIYDWQISDVWKAIHEHGWPYCRLYDLMHQYGVPLRDMRLSSIIHETAVTAPFLLQEFEPETFNRIVTRVPGMNTAARIGEAEFHCPEQLPIMFLNWRAYRDYLLENLIPEPDLREKMAKRFAANDERFADFPSRDLIHRYEVKTILTNDHGFVFMTTRLLAPEFIAWINQSKGIFHARDAEYSKFTAPAKIKTRKKRPRYIPK